MAPGGLSSRLYEMSIVFLIMTSHTRGSRTPPLMQISGAISGLGKTCGKQEGSYRPILIPTEPRVIPGSTTRGYPSASLHLLTIPWEHSALCCKKNNH
jgi:hypothetical protein